MIKTIFICLLLTIRSGVAKEHKIWSRLTFYNPAESGGYRVAAPNIKRNIAGYGVSAHPDFKFFTKIKIPILKNIFDSDDKFTVIDRGSAVTSKKAAKGKGYVFDIFVDKRGKSFNNFVKKMPTWAWVIIEK